MAVTNPQVNPLGSKLPAPVASAEGLLSTAPSTPMRDAFRRLLRRRSAVVGMVILGFLALVALLADVLAPYDPIVPLIGIEDVSKRAPPCIHLLGCPADQPQHLMGTDGNVRDLFSRMLFGARLSLVIGLSTVSFAIVVGTMLGAVAGYVGGWTDNIIMRLMDVLLAFPALLLAIAIVTVLGPGLINALIAIAIVEIPAYARVVRASVLSIKEQDFISASRALGASPMHILFARVLPNADAAHRPGHAGHCVGDPQRGGAVLHWAGRATPPAGMGPDVGAGAQSGVHRTAFGVLSWHCHHADRARLQPFGRRLAGRAGPAAGASRHQGQVTPACRPQPPWAAAPPWRRLRQAKTIRTTNPICT